MFETGVVRAILLRKVKRHNMDIFFIFTNPKVCFVFCVLLIWIKVGQGPTALAVGAVGLFGHFFSHLSFLVSFSLSLGDGPI